jgi:putative transposase
VLANTFLSLRRIWADGGYAGQLLAWVGRLRDACRIELQIIKRSDKAHGFRVLPKRWVVERTFGWLGRWRRLSKDYEFHTDTSEAIIRIVMTRLMLRRLARHRASRRPRCRRGAH